MIEMESEDGPLESTITVRSKNRSTLELITWPPLLAIVNDFPLGNADKGEVMSVSDGYEVVLVTFDYDAGWFRKQLARLLAMTPDISIECVEGVHKYFADRHEAWEFWLCRDREIFDRPVPRSRSLYVGKVSDGRWVEYESFCMTLPVS